MNNLLKIDGSIGGGSVLRLAIPLSLLYSQPIRIYNIRSNRKKPGLRPQHLIGIQTISELSNSKIKNAYVDSTEITFFPNDLETQVLKEININIGTAASISLIIQSVANYSLLTRNDVILNFIGGGTHTNWSPTIDYVSYVSTQMYSLFGLNIETNLDKYGFYPKGGAKGCIKFINSNVSDSGILNWEDVTISSIDVYSLASSNLAKQKVAERQIEGFQELYKQDINYHLEYVNSQSIGTSLTAVIKYTNGIHSGNSELGIKGVPAEEIGRRVAKKINQILTSGISIDNHLADQILIPFISTKQPFNYLITELTDHVQTNITIINKFTDQPIQVNYQDGKHYITYL